MLKELCIINMCFKHSKGLLYTCHHLQPFAKEKKKRFVCGCVVAEFSDSVFSLFGSFSVPPEFRTCAVEEGDIKMRRFVHQNMCVCINTCTVCVCVCVSSTISFGAVGVFS